MDPLSALREYTIRDDLDKIISVGGDLHFGTDYSFPSSTPTAFRSKQGGLYTLDTLLHFLRHQHLKHTDYLQSSRLHRLPPVTLPDRKPLLDFLSGKTPSSDSILSPLLPHHQDQQDYQNDKLTQQPPPLPSEDAEGTEAVNFLSLIRSLERPLKDREAILKCKNRDFYNVLTMATKREEDRLKMEVGQRKDGLVAKTRLVADDVEMKVAGGGHVKGVPIILVPSASQTLITIYNVKEFLEDGVFVPIEAKVKEGMARPECVTVQKKLSRDRAVAAYEVRDKTVGFKAEDWERVVSVFVLGKEWQFKDWPFKDHVEIFNKIIGFHVRFEDDSIESARNVKQWNVKIISISKNKRHQDRAAALEVWDRLESFMRSRSHA